MRDTDRVLEGALWRLQLGWDQFDLARDRRGKSCDVASDKAVSWCCVGAIEAAAESIDPHNGKLADKALYRVAFIAGCADDDWEHGIAAAVMKWQDTNGRSAEDVIIAVKQALCAS